MTETRTGTDRRVAIVGTGFSGLCLGIHLKKAGFNDFVLFEKADGIGGTWRENTYPGAECDIPSALYSFSFERNPRWTHKWSEQPEILAYIDHCATKYGLYPHVKFNKEVRRATFDDTAGIWHVETSDGEVEEFDVFVSAVGQLHKPWKPDIPGAESFRGISFHSAQWDHSVSLEGKRVASIVNAASALQYIPEIAPVCEHLTVFQRSANWVVEKKDREYTEFEKVLGTIFPPFTKLYRFWIYFRGDVLLYPLMSGKQNSWLRKKSEQDAIAHMEEKIADTELRRKLITDYPMGAKRILFSDNYYDALARDNVYVETTPIERIEDRGVVTKGGTLHELDILVYGTGFETTSFLTPMEVVGRGGVSLNEQWEAAGAEAYLGITHTGYPNFFMMYGPNTNLGHNSIIIMIEAQTRYILSCLNVLSKRQAKWLDVKAPVQQSYNAWVQDRLRESVWANVDRSWYKNEAGKITNNWVGRTTEYRRKTRSVNPDDYEFA